MIGLLILLVIISLVAIASTLHAVMTDRARRQPEVFDYNSRAPLP